MTDDRDELDKLREELNGIDEDLLRLVERRQELVAHIGQVKQQMGRGTRDFGREKVVIGRARALAAELGLDPNLASNLFGELIRASLATQERDRLVRRGEGGGREVLVIGGAGRMGRWFADFLDAQNFRPTLADPSGKVDGYTCVDDWTELDLAPFYLIVVATPMKVANEILAQLAERAPSGVVLDISSLKEPVRPGLEALIEAGVSVTSVHPMFGPDVDLLSGRHVVFVDLGDRPALDAARSLFEDTMASMVEMELEQHDRAMAFVLGLSHALNIVFGDALAQSSPSARHLDEVSSTTFSRQVGVAAEVARENPHLYSEIQALNPFTEEVLEALADSIGHLREYIDASDESGFVEMMERGRRFLTARPETRS